MGSSNRANYLFQVKKAIFLKAFYSDYDAMVYLTKIALQRRKFMKRKVQQMEKQQIELAYREAIAKEIHQREESPYGNQ